jgi:hypothetical protein
LKAEDAERLLPGSNVPFGNFEQGRPTVDLRLQMIRSNSSFASDQSPNSSQPSAASNCRWSFNPSFILKLLCGTQPALAPVTGYGNRVFVVSKAIAMLVIVTGRQISAGVGIAKSDMHNLIWHKFGVSVRWDRFVHLIWKIGTGGADVWIVDLRVPILGHLPAATPANSQTHKFIVNFNKSYKMQTFITALKPRQPLYGLQSRILTPTYCGGQEDFLNLTFHLPYSCRKQAHANAHAHMRNSDIIIVNIESNEDLLINVG